MTFIGAGDLSQSYLQRRENARLTAELTQLTEAFATGRRSLSPADGFRDLGALSALQSDLARMDASRVVIDEAALVASAGQLVLDQIATTADTAAGALLLTVSAPQPISIQSAAADASDAFLSAISGLNTQVAGRSIFAGTAFDRPATVPGGTILDDLVLSVAAETTAAGVEAAIDAYFAPGGAFETTAYQGSTAPAPVRLGLGATAEPSLVATDPRISEMLAALAKGAILERGVLAGSSVERAALAERSGQDILTATQNLIDARTAIGSEEGRIETARTGLNARYAAAELAMTDLVAADPFDTGARLRELETQLQSLYAVIGRLSGLSLATFLR